MTELGFTNPLVYAMGMSYGRINIGKCNGQFNLKQIFLPVLLKGLPISIHIVE